VSNGDDDGDDGYSTVLYMSVERAEGDKTV
jgi:hypothetical protein